MAVLTPETRAELAKRAEPHVRMSISLPADIAEFAERAAVEAGVSVSKFVAFCIERMMENDR
jgi:hypothetical protein